MAKRSFWSRRPGSHVERGEIVDFLDDNEVRTLNKRVQAQYDDGYVAAEARYLADLAANDRASNKAIRTRLELATAVSEHAAAFRTWQRRAEAAVDAPIGARLAPHLGDRTVAEYLSASPDDKIRWFGRLFSHLEEFPELVGDPAAHAALKQKAAALSRAKRAHADALRTRARTVRAVKAAAKAFDKQYGELARLIELTDPDVGADLPRFRRVEGRDEGEVDVSDEG